MSLESDYTLSFYQEIAKLHDQHDIHIVQHISTKRIFVKKRLSVFDADVYNYLKANPYPGIPHVYETIIDDNKLIVIEEYINGSSVQDLLKRWGPFDEQLAKDVVLQLCDILDWLHNADTPIIHRDIKPANLILTDEGKLYLIDFNAAKKSQEAKNKDTVLIGTAGYAAPEQYGFASSNAQTDIYAVGVLLNELLTGKLITEEIYSGQPTKKRVPWRAIITRCTAFDPFDRYANIGQLKYVLLKQDKRFRFPNKLRSYMPPGFRSKKLWKMVIAIIGYLSYALISFSIEFEEDDTLFTLWSYRVLFFLMMIGVTLFAANYLNVHSTLPLTNSRNRFVKMIGVVIGSLFIVFLLVFFMAFVEMIPA